MQDAASLHLPGPRLELGLLCPPVRPKGSIEISWPLPSHQVTGPTASSGDSSIGGMGSIGTPPIEPEVSIDDVLVKALKCRGFSFFDSSSTFDKQGLTECHAEAAREFKRMVKDPRWRSRTFSHHVLDPLLPSAPFLDLERMVLTDLKPPDAQLDPDGIPVSVHHGRIVYGTLCVEPFLTGGVRTVFEDTKGLAVPLVIDNAVSTTASEAEVCNMFPKGMEVAIKEPAYTQLWKDGTLGINVANPADVVPTADMTLFSRATMLLKEQGPPSWRRGMDSMKQLYDRAEKHSSDGQYTRALRCHRWSAELLGNMMGGVRDWKGPSLSYDPEQEMVDIYVSFCPERCKTYLRMGSYLKALEETELYSIDPRLKMPRATCLHMMHLYEEELAYLEELQASLGTSECDELLQQDISNQISRARIARDQSGSGIYELDDEEFWRLSRLPDPPGWAPYAGSIWLRTGTEHGICLRTGEARRRREPGMFASKDVKPGELLLVANPLARGEEPPRASPGIRFHSKRPPRRGSGGECDISSWSAQFQNTFVEVIAKAQQSPQYAAQLKSMLRDRGSTDRNPSLELFDVEDTYNKYGDVEPMEEHQRHLVKVDIRDIRSVLATNGLVQGGLYGLPSFFKHSCAPNCVQYTGPLQSGGAMFIAATRRIAAGEELSLHTVSMFHSKFLRSEEFFRQGRGDFCSCPRCTFEDQALCNDIPELPDLLFKYRAEIEACCHPFRVLDMWSKKFPNPFATTTPEDWLLKEVLQVDDSEKLLTMCCEVADSLDSILKRDDCAHLSQQQKDWIQCSFALAYVLPVLADPGNSEGESVDEIVRFLTSVEPGTSSALTILAIVMQCRIKMKEFSLMQESDYEYERIRRYWYETILSNRYQNQNLYFPYKEQSYGNLLLWGWNHLPRLLFHIYVGVNH